MSAQKNIHQKTYNLSYYQCDKSGNLRLMSLLNLLQDMADAHAEELGVGLTFCKANKLAWVGSDYHLIINNLPKFGQEITIQTWASKQKKYSAIRDFLITDISGNELVRASSQWLLLGVYKKRPVTIKDTVPAYSIVDKRALETEFVKISTPQSFDYKKTYEASFDDIDMNQHVNNAVYVRWAINSLPLGFFDNHSIKEVEINYRKECRQDDAIDVFVSHDVPSSTHIISSSDQELVKIRFSYS